MNAVDLIQRKRDRLLLTEDEIEWLIRSYTEGTVTDYQMSAMAMAVYLNGLAPSELTAWTGAMLHSGEVLDLSDISRPKVDKHSTGGVGDKVSIPLAPMVAACGVAVPMMSGRGLGHTGGTLDKLESIPGFTTSLDPDRFRQVLSQCGLVLAGQSETLVPADRKLYALRDATGTVESIPLIASSIMSKKMAENLDGLVLDVKVGAGAFMKDVTKARELARTMVEIGASYDVKTVALLTGMDQPLGNEVGNANEIAESIALLRGEGPSDLLEVTMSLGVEMLRVAEVETDEQKARHLLQRTIDDGAALDVLGRVVSAQGGDSRVIDDPAGVLPKTQQRAQYQAEEPGFLCRLDALAIGTAAMRLGAGRERKEDTIDPSVGIRIHHKVGEKVEKDEPLLTLFYRHPARLDEALSVLEGAIEIGANKPDQSPLVIERIEG
ncbi:MAG TPA: thymidine phosphorylase [Acidimicrobiia bacterium]|nr:thymidine phosphorylase [Acidimicrobiia bacterium]